MKFRRIQRIIPVICLLATGIICRAAVLVEYFYQPGCRECELVSTHIKPVMEERFSGHYTLHEYDIGISENFIRLADCQDRLGINANEPVCMIVNGEYPFNGYEQIEAGLFERIDSCIAAGEHYEAPPDAPDAPETRSLLDRRSRRITLIAVIAAALADGVNPCVFSTLVFFASLLAASGIRGRRLLLTGLSYCLACFTGYLALGFGLYHGLKAFSGYRTLQTTLEWAMAGTLLILAVLSFRDALRFRRSGRADSVTLQLPGSVKNRIHRVMKAGLAYRWLIPGAFGIGILVTALESICTGQVYVPTMVLLVREEGTGSRWLPMLLLYNTVFILPLLVLFALVWKGLDTPKLLAWSRKHVVPAKILLGALFILLAMLMLWL